MVFECKKGPLNVKIDIKKTSIKECIKGIVFLEYYYFIGHIFTKEK